MLTLLATCAGWVRPALLTLLFAGGLFPRVAGGVDTEVATGATEAVSLWAKVIWIESAREMYFTRMIEKNANAIIESKTDLRGAGETLTYTLARKLTSAGVLNDGLMEGSEEELPFQSDSLTLFQIRNAVRLAGAMSEKRTAFDQRKVAKTQLTTWLAEYVDDNIFTNLDSSPTTVVYAGTAATTAQLTATDLFTPALINRTIAVAKTASPKLYPVKISGRDLYVVLVHTHVAYDMSVGNNSGTWQTVQQYAGVRDLLNNRIFSGSLGAWGGAVIHEHEKVPIATNWGAGANVAGASNFFLARQAGIIAWGSSPKAWEKEFDYNNRHGFCIGVIFAFKKAVLGAVDHGFIAIRTARTNIS